MGNKSLDAHIFDEARRHELGWIIRLKIIIEILSGTRSYRTFPVGKLVEHAWKMWNKGKALELLDKSIGDEFSADKALSCIQIGLLCVQERADDRPTMRSVLDMLEGERVTLPLPKLPGFWFDTESRLKYAYIDSTNEPNMLLIDPRVLLLDEAKSAEYAELPNALFLNERFYTKCISSYRSTKVTEEGVRPSLDSEKVHRLFKTPV
ncbi:unnamed protein product [Fraxinus pennsylvanica]|uniref:Uncharacterized protein n=1 Tax=Fraxinus pennsylvanica TaxID=56036 RepID=A0AAD2DG92_9LAMI|nr:unnamed protein product [Fraxinus pennsylvanica]